MDLDDLTKLCEEAGISLKSKLLLKLSESDLSSMTDDDWLRFFTDMKIDNTQTIRSTRSAMIKLYDHCISKGVINYNPFDSAKLTQENILFVAQNDIYISPLELKIGIDKVKNKDLGNCLLRMLYEGIRERIDLYNLKLDQIDLVNKIITFPDHVINMSNDLYESILIYNDTWKYHKSSFIRAYPNSFVKIRDYKLTENNYDAFESMVARMIGQAEIKQVHLYGSGFINFLYKKCGSIKKMDELFYADDSVRGLIINLCDEIEAYGKEYGLNKEGKYIRYDFKGYFESFKIKMQKTE